MADRETQDGRKNNGRNLTQEDRAKGGRNSHGGKGKTEKSGKGSR